MLLFDFLSKIGGLNRLLWTLGGLLIGYLYKDRLALEISESIYVLKYNGQDLPDFQARDILVKQVFFCCKSKKSKQLDKAIRAGKKKL
jgi:hypothetical protein